MGEARKVWAHGNLIEVETLDTGATAPRKRWLKRFTKFPGTWEEVLGKARASGSTYAVAIVLVYEAWKLSTRGHKPIVKLTDAMLKRVHVGERGKRVALRKLEGLRLVDVERRANRNPLVTVYFFEQLPCPVSRSYPAR
jgi:hypothetical protein